MSQWGQSSWGQGAWGAGVVSVPTLLGVTGGPCDVLGGTVITLHGSGFTDPATIDVLDGGSVVVGTAYYFESDLDMRDAKLMVGMPALPVGVYGIRVTVDAGVTGILTSAVTYKVFAAEGKVHRVRRRLAKAWATGERYLA